MKASAEKEVMVWRNADHNYLMEKRGNWGGMTYVETTNIFDAIFNAPGIGSSKHHRGYRLVKVRLSLTAEELNDD